MEKTKNYFTTGGKLRLVNLSEFVFANERPESGRNLTNASCDTHGKHPTWSRPTNQRSNIVSAHD